MRRTRRWGHGTAAIARHLYAASTPLTQVELAAVAGVSQPAVSKVLTRLAAASAAARIDGGWVPYRHRLAADYASRYTRHLANESWWYRIDSPNDQATEIIARHPHALLSGDVGADRIAPWNVPTNCIVYDTINAEHMDGMGFVPADARLLATVILRPVPDERLRNDRLDEVVPLLHLVADLIDLDRPDRAEQIERLHDQAAMPA